MLGQSQQPMGQPAADRVSHDAAQNPRGCRQHPAQICVDAPPLERRLAAQQEDVVVKLGGGAVLVASLVVEVGLYSTITRATPG